MFSQRLSSLIFLGQSSLASQISKYFSSLGLGHRMSGPITRAIHNQSKRLRMSSYYLHGHRNIQVAYTNKEERTRKA